MNRKQLQLRHGLNMIVSMAAGFMDAYSYLARGKVFATGQTGNFVLLAVNLARMDWAMTAQYFVTICMFWLGVFASTHMRCEYAGRNRNTWERDTLIAEILVFFLIGFLPGSVPNTLVNSLIAFCAAMQFCCFRTLGEQAAYASIFCTGNMRSCAENLYLGLVQKDSQALKNGLRYLSVLGTFFAGVLLGVLGDRWLGEKAAWGVCAVLMAALAVQCISKNET